MRLNDFIEICLKVGSSLILEKTFITAYPLKFYIVSWDKL